MLQFWGLYVRGLFVRSLYGRGLYGRGLYVLCCPKWGLFVRGLYVWGLFDLDSNWTGETYIGFDRNQVLQMIIKCTNCTPLQRQIDKSLGACMFDMDLGA